MQKGVYDKFIINLLFVFLIIPFFQIPYLTNKIPVIGSVYKIWQIISAIIMLILFLRKTKYSKIINKILIFLLILLISTIFNDGDIAKCITMSLHVILISLIIDYEIRSNSKAFLDSLEFYLSLIIYINFITVMLYPDGMYLSSSGYFSNWFLGFKNMHILYILPGILCSCLNSYFDGDKLKKRTKLLILVSLISIVKCNSSTGIIGIFTFIITFLMYTMLKKTSIFNILNYFAIYIISFFSIVIIRIQELLSFIIVDLLHKDLTFTGRTFIWDYVIEFIKKKKFLGYGVENSLIRLNKTNIYQSYHAHNQILEIIYKSGLIGLIFFGLIAYSAFKEIWKNRKCKQAFIIGTTMFSYFIMWLTEAYDFEYLIFLFVICYNVKYFIEDRKDETNE